MNDSQRSVRPCELLELGGSEFTVAWCPHTMHGDRLMELLGPASKHGLHRVHFNVEVTIERHFADHFTSFFLNLVLVAGLCRS